MLKKLLLILSVCLAPSLSAATLTIRPIQVCDDAGANCANNARTLFEAEGDKIWAQAGIDLMFLAWQTLNETDFLSIDLSTWDELDNLWATSPDPNPLAVSMYFVNELSDGGGTTFGIAATPGNRTAIADAVFAYNGGTGRRDTIAHELGHSLGLPHRDDEAADYVMTAGSARTIPGGLADIIPTGAGLSKLSADEIRIAQTSDLLVPEPSTVLLSLTGFGLLALWRKRNA